MDNILSNEFIKENYDAKIFDLYKLKTNLNTLFEYCESKGIQFEQIYNNYINLENSDDWKLEEKIHETEDEELIGKYYSTIKMYLFELTLHECRWDYINLFWSIVEFARRSGIKKVLDYGGGVGGLVIYLNSKGIHCDYADIPGETWNYASFRFRKNKMDVSQLSEDDLYKISSNYELIVSLDCLEHLKSLSKYIKLFNSLLRDGAFLLVKSSFYGKGIHLASNHKYNSLIIFNEMMKSNGFFFKGQFVTRLKKNFLIPNRVVKLLRIKTSSGKKLIYTKGYDCNEENFIKEHESNKI